jgi:hypothetical protein
MPSTIVAEGFGALPKLQLDNEAKNNATVSSAVHSSG